MKGRGPKIRALLLLTAGIAVVSLVQVTVSWGGAESAATRAVSVRDDFFSPKRITISSGDRLKWTWREEGTHNVRFRKVPRGGSRSPGSTLKTSGTFSRKFRKRGTYRYVCTIHEDSGMTGSVKVE
jgi:plastocyanin